MAAVAAALTPREPTSETGRMRAFDAVMRKAARRANPVEHDGAGEDLAEPVVHSRTVQAGPGLSLRVSDIEPVDDERLMEIAARAAARLSERSRDRNA
ncbi:hypothetical protein ACFYZ9_33545 [Streptomyces sp. NPDC001691]|uniref:hypothetical protein n=1 Tax=Streptomyces sp. NPDC001691 TaxID=3364600 RepID=UPI0036C727E6